MLVKLTRGCIVPGHPNAQPGDTLEVPADVAQDLIAIRKAERVVAAPPALEHREPDTDNREAKPVKRSKSKLA